MSLHLILQAQHKMALWSAIMHSLSTGTILTRICAVLRIVQDKKLSHNTTSVSASLWIATEALRSESTFSGPWQKQSERGGEAGRK